MTSQEPTRRRTLQTLAALAGAAFRPQGRAPAAETLVPTGDIEDRVAGLLVGSLVGDALGGPVEFQPPEQVHALPGGPKAWRAEERLDEDALTAARDRFRLRGYSPLRPVPEPYGHWTADAPAGTVTDDSRHKMILMHALRRYAAHAEGPIESLARQFLQRDLARAYLDWREAPAIARRAEFVALCDEWLAEIALAARWVNGGRNLERALPPDRLWVGLPTCCGQMTLPPLAAIFPGDPTGAYLAAHAIAFHDNGWGKDLNACLVAGLAQALVLPGELASRRESWTKIIDAMRRTDPFRQREVPWSQRAIERWLAVVDRAVEQAAGRPARLFTWLDEQFAETTKWEAQVPFVVMLATARLCDYEPLASMQLCLEWGHDTDSDAQLGGAFFGALHGAAVFPAEARDAVAHHLQTDYGEDLDEWRSVLGRLRRRASPAMFAQL